MKYGVLAILVTIMFFAAPVLAEDSEKPLLYSNDMAIYLLEGTVSQPKFTRPPFKSFESDLWCLKFFKFFSRMEYGFEKETLFSMHGNSTKRQALVTRFQLFEKPIYLTFSFSK